jgi:hypothetical protein
MNINLERSYPQLSVRGRITDALKLPLAKLNPSDIINKYWPLNTFDFYISLDQTLGEIKKDLK